MEHLFTRPQLILTLKAVCREQPGAAIAGSEMGNMSGLYIDCPRMTTGQVRGGCKHYHPRPARDRGGDRVG